MEILYGRSEPDMVPVAAGAILIFAIIGLIPIINQIFSRMFQPKG